MVQVLVTLIALASTWLLDGGIRRRDRHAIREELELADILGDRPEAEMLRAAADARLQRYLRPPFTKRVAPMLRSASIFLVCLAGALVGAAAFAGDNASEGSKAATSILFGAMAAVLAIVLQTLVDGLIRLNATRIARVAASQRAREQSA